MYKMKKAPEQNTTGLSKSDVDAWTAETPDAGILPQHLVSLSTPVYKRPYQSLPFIPHRDGDKALLYSAGVEVSGALY